VIGAWLERIKVLPGSAHPSKLTPSYPLPEAG
jgi:hypothetical protein